MQILSDRRTVGWSPEPSSMTYNLYSGPLSTLPGMFGGCAQAGVAGTSLLDSSTPSLGGGLFFIITGKNRLGEEGSEGRSTGDVERINSTPCP